MSGFNLLAATRVIESAMPFVLYRLMAYLGIAVGFLFSALSGAGLLIAFASLSAKPAAFAGFGAAVGCAGFAFALHTLKNFFFFDVEAGQLALLAALADGVKLPEGKAQIAFAKTAATSRFNATEFFEIKRMLGNALTEMPEHYLPCLSKPASPVLKRMSIRLAGLIAGSASQAMLALHFQREQDNPWRSAQSALLMQAAGFPQLLRYRLYALIFEYGGFAVFYALMLYPVDAAAASLPVDVGLWRTAFALLFAWALKAAFLTPIATSALVTVYLQCYAERQADSPDLSQALATHSCAYKKIVDRAG
ncbi:hypothetical protein F6R98_00665 [Candidatus Methylospira mobilis]|uniref:Uncharacterized protein n=1 Tax=Candidatus Methylospira mobilis TaxID=1808979 RepID=A0A5Q0BDV5_9GAMM|nr:hypothetical protein [Candidatus Methylospira mobilis]QFY41312.1 hypothetical protein F6R98_00665 [Candidatus Methylospira mobilis]